MLNNWAFAFHISVPLHIILRSFGSVTTLSVGWLAGKKYSGIQICSVAALTVGVIVSAWADARQKVSSAEKSSLCRNLKQWLISFQGAEMQLTSHAINGNPTDLFAGITVLFAAQLVSAVMGIYVESTYGRYGRHWRENLFYSHFLGLFFSLAIAPTLIRQAHRLLGSPGRLQIPIPQAVAAWLGDPGMVFTKGRLAAVLENGDPTGPRRTVGLPLPLLHLAMNAVTQVVCISGVNRLSAQTTAVTVTVVLNLRKLVSFLLSCIIFGNPVSGLMALGASIVFASGALYGWDSSRKGKKATKPQISAPKEEVEMEKIKEDGAAAARS